MTAWITVATVTYLVPILILWPAGWRRRNPKTTLRTVSNPTGVRPADKSGEALRLAAHSLYGAPLAILAASTAATIAARLGSDIPLTILITILAAAVAYRLGENVIG